jgi:hypothetical protein
VVVFLEKKITESLPWLYCQKSKPSKSEFGDSADQKMHQLLSQTGLNRITSKMGETVTGRKRQKELPN